jgi:hypothetical protein
MATDVLSFDDILLVLFIILQLAYGCTFLIEGYFYTRPVNWVHLDTPSETAQTQYPFIVLFYPVLK